MSGVGHVRFDFTGRRVLITGGTKGLGLEMARQFSKAGAQLVLTYRRDEVAAKTAQVSLAPGPVQLIAVDLTEPGAASRMVAEAGPVDIYIHNAAATAFKPLMEIAPHHVQKTFQLTVAGFLEAVQAVAPLMKNGGSIISISGMDNLKVVPRHGLLGAAKSALETLTYYLSHELAHKNIQVNSVKPGFFESEGTQKFLGPAFKDLARKIRGTSPWNADAPLSEIAALVLYLCTAESRWVTGQVIVADGGSDRSLDFGGLEGFS